MVASLLLLVLGNITYLTAGALAIPCEPYSSFPHPENCSGFYMCDKDGNPNLFFCPVGLHYNTDKAGCDFPENSNCTIENITESYHQDQSLNESDVTAEDTSEHGAETGLLGDEPVNSDDTAAEQTDINVDETVGDENPTADGETHPETMGFSDLDAFGYDHAGEGEKTSEGGEPVVTDAAGPVEEPTTKENEELPEAKDELTTTLSDHEM